MTLSIYTTKNLLPTRLIIGLMMSLALIFLVSLTMGRLDISLTDAVAMFRSAWLGTPITDDLLAKQMGFIWIRLPRCIMAVIVGMGLSVSGAVYQGLFRNPLVSPDILGVAAGCTFGAALGLILPGSDFIKVHLLSFGFGLLAVFLSVGISRIISVKPIIVLVLSGMVVLSFFNAMLMLIKYFSDPYDELPSIIFWIMGSFTGVTWSGVWIALPATLIGVSIFMALRFRLNILSLGDVQAKALGANPKAFRVIFIITSTLIVAMTVSICGQISWIGLIIPHMARTIAGPSHEHMLPVTALLGGIFMLAADVAARTLIASEIPVGIITALSGAPVFGYLLYRNRGSGWL
ncbi:MAG: iron ABC transporter permease [Desulfobacteraceae bacterium]|nr:MAG: iron ABC transporter permease [Desulfobacteraceae bacterium]